MSDERSQAETQKEEDELKKLALKRYKIIAIIINVVFACLFIACAVLSFFGGEFSVFAFIFCCVFSLVWTFVYNKFAHAHLLKQSKKYAYVYIAIAIIIAAVTLLTLFKLPPDVVMVQFTEGTSLRDVFPWVIGVKCICDCAAALGLGFFFL